MPLSKEFKTYFQERAKTDPEFRKGLLTQAINQFVIDGDFITAKSLLRDYINATLGFQDLAEMVGISAQSLMRMLSSKGNPNGKNLTIIFSTLSKREGLDLG